MAMSQQRQGHGDGDGRTMMWVVGQGAAAVLSHGPCAWSVGLTPKCSNQGLAWFFET